MKKEEIGIGLCLSWTILQPFLTTLIKWTFFFLQEFKIGSVQSMYLIWQEISPWDKTRDRSYQDHGTLVFLNNSDWLKNIEPPIRMLKYVHSMNYRENLYWRDPSVHSGTKYLWCLRLLSHSVTPVSWIREQSFILQGEISLYGWPPAWLFWMQLLCLCLITNIFTCWPNPLINWLQSLLLFFINVSLEVLTAD